MRNIRTLCAAAGVTGRFDAEAYKVRRRGDRVSGTLPLAVGATVDLGNESLASLAARGRWPLSDVVKHTMGTLLEAVLCHPYGESTPAEWVARLGAVRR